MPTISEPQWPERDERTRQIVREFADGTDSVDVLRARLYGNGLRGAELDSVSMAAQNRKASLNVKAEPIKVLVMGRDGTQNIIRFKDTSSAGKAVELLRKQPNVLFAARVEL